MPREFVRPYLFTSEQWVPRPRAEVFPFFADASNLDRITPPWLRFRIVTPLPIDLRAGALIEYRLRVRGFPLRWLTEIAEWNPPVRFVDVQLRGPYRLWRHTHEFHEENGGTRCIDRVEYYPRGGALVHRLFVRRDVERIFAYRQARLSELWPTQHGATTS